MAVTSLGNRLSTSWTLWFDNPQSRRSWKAGAAKSNQWAEAVTPVATFRSTDHFWSMYDCVCRPATELPVGSGYSFFAYGVRPLWEDPVNRRGGMWYSTSDLSRSAEMDRIWLAIVIGLMAGVPEINGNGTIVGANLMVRSKQGYRLQLWCRDGPDDALLAVGRLLRTMTGRGGYQMRYKLHDPRRADRRLTVGDTCDGPGHLERVW